MGSYGNGLGILSHGLDMVVITAFCLAIFALSLKLRLSDQEVERLLADEEELHTLSTSENVRP
jgi:hypothetical protein